MQVRTFIIGLSCLTVFALLVLIFTPVPAPKAKNCFTVNGEISAVFSACCQDVNLKLKGDNRRFYINRGLDNNEIKLAELRALLVGKKVEMNVIRRNWTPLDPSHSLAPVAEIRTNGKIVFSRMK